MKLTILLILIPFICLSQHYDNEIIIIQEEVQVESKLVPIHYLGKTLLINRNIAIELKLKSGQQINTKQDFYFILAENVKFNNRNKKLKDGNSRPI